MFSLENLPKHTYLKIEDKFRKKIFSLLNKSYSRAKLKTLLKCDLSAIKLGRHLWRIDSFLCACELLGFEFVDVEKFIQGLRIGKRGEVINYSVLSTCMFNLSNVAELVAHSMGDGHITKLYSFNYFNKDYRLIQHVHDIIKKTFGDVNLLIRKDKKNVWGLYTSSSVGYVIFMAGGPKGNKVSTPFLVPEWVLNGSIGIKKVFVRALFDDEGRVRKGMIDLRISKHKELSANLQEFLQQIKSLLLDLGIDNVTIKIYQQNGNRVRGCVNISWRKNLEIFYQNVGFLHSERNEKLKGILESYKLWIYRPNETKKLILGLLEKYGKLSTVEISKFLKRTSSRTLVILYDLEAKCMVRRYSKINPPGTIVWCKT